MTFCLSSSTSCHLNWGGSSINKPYKSGSHLLQLPFLRVRYPSLSSCLGFISSSFNLCVFKLDTEFMIVILCWVNPEKTIWSLPELELFLKYLNVFRKLKDLNKLFPRHGEEKKIKGFEGSGRKNNNAIFTSVKILLSLFYLLNQLHMDSYLKNITSNIFSRKGGMINSQSSYWNHDNLSYIPILKTHKPFVFCLCISERSYLIWTQINNYVKTKDKEKHRHY